MNPESKSKLQPNREKPQGVSYSRAPDGRPLASAGVTRDISEPQRVEQALRAQIQALDARLKALNCLYDLSRLGDKPGVSLEEIYQGAVEILYRAWQPLEIVGARVVVDGQEYCTEGFCADAPGQRAADIAAFGQPCGVVQVHFAGDRPESDNGPFRAEETNLLDEIAERLGRITEHKRTEAALRMARDELERRVEERTAELKRGHQRERVLNALLRLSMEDTSLNEQLERALDEILSIPWLPVQPQGAIFLVGDDASPGTPPGAGTLELRAQRGFDRAAQLVCRRVAFGQCLCGRAAASQNLIFAEHGDDRHELHQEGLVPHGHYCVPILSAGRSIGTIALYLHHGQPRDAQQEEFLQAVAHTLAGIIERKRVEEALRQSEAGLAEAQRIARLGNWDWNMETNTLSWSDEIYRIFGLAPQEFGATYEAFLNSVHPDDRAFVRRSVDEALHGHKPYNIDHRIVLPDGSEHVVHEQAEITYGPSGKPLHMVGTVQDVTERKQAEAAVLQERGRLARELHDSVTQSLYSITLLAEGWKRLQRAGRLDGTEDPLTELGEIAQQALKEMRLMVHELRPPDLEEVGLLGALHQRLGAVEKRAGVDAHLMADGLLDLSPQVEECLYRIALEALNNTLKHAGATSVMVHLRANEDRVQMEVIDNGCGFDVETLDTRRGMGLKGMQERAKQLGGAFSVESTPSEGTRVSVSLGICPSA